jgi:hypothetical protein
MDWDVNRGEYPNSTGDVSMTESNEPTTTGGTAPIRKPKLSAEAKASIVARLREIEPKGTVSLRRLRAMQQLTQKQVAATMGTEQDRVSRLERRADLRVSTLREYVAALGGSLRLVAELPGHEPQTIRLPARDTTARTPRTMKPTHK